MDEAPPGMIAGVWIVAGDDAIVSFAGVIAGDATVAGTLPGAVG